jgi:hypothetical protein
MPNEPSFDSIPTRHSLLLRLRHWSDQSGWQEFFDTYSSQPIPGTSSRREPHGHR